MLYYNCIYIYNVIYLYVYLSIYLAIYLSIYIYIYIERERDKLLLYMEVSIFTVSVLLCVAAIGATKKKDGREENDKDTNTSWLKQHMH